MKTARRSFGKDYICKCEWEEDCFVQCGDSGIVLGKGSLQQVFDAENPLKELVNEMDDKNSYITAFFEAFPKEPATFIRGEGKTVEEAEESAWKQYQKFKSCSGHEFERGTYKNGAGLCKHCGLFNSKAFDPLYKCIICGIPSYYTFDNDENCYCENCSSHIPEDKKPDWMKRHEKIKKYREDKGKNAE